MRDDTPIRRRPGSGRANDEKPQKSYQPYIDAEWGFTNHWYPALFSDELPEDHVEGIQICGIQIVLRRANGKVFALKDQCIHRGVRLSKEIVKVAGKCMEKNMTTIGPYVLPLSEQIPVVTTMALRFMIKMTGKLLKKCGQEKLAAKLPNKKHYVPDFNPIKSYRK